MQPEGAAIAKISRVLVIGYGVMGRGIAKSFADAGFISQVLIRRAGQLAVFWSHTAICNGCRTRCAYPGTKSRMAGLSNTTIISIVDDDELLRNAITDLLHSFEYAVVAFASGTEFLRSDRVHDSACLISDTQMPGMDGLELQHWLIASGHAIPIIFLTASPMRKFKIEQ